MSVLLGLRIALAGGRDSRIRFGLTVLGCAVGTLLVLLTLVVMPALQGRIDRYAWHRTDASSPATAPDAALWLPVTDRYDGRSIVRFQVAALGEAPPVPPGLSRLPDPGEVFVSPALAELIGTVPADQLARRFPGEVVGLIGADGLVSPDELVAVIGRPADELRATPGTMRVRGIEAPGEPVDANVLVQLMVGLLAVLLLGPVVVFVSRTTRIDAAKREQRFAALRLGGATRTQTGFIAIGETASAALVGAGLAYVGFLLLIPVLQWRVVPDGLRFPSEDLRAPTWQVVLVVAAVPLVAMATTVVTLHRVQVSPLGARRQVIHRQPTVWYLAPLAAGYGLTLLISVARVVPDPGTPFLWVVGGLTIAAAVSQLVGTYLAGVYICMWVGRGLARLNSSAPAMIAARRIAADPHATFRAVGGVAIAAFIATLFSTIAVAEQKQIRTTPTTLDQGVVMVLTRGATDEALAPLLAQPGVVVARQGPGGVVVAACTDLARVTSLDCPLPQTEATESALSGLSRPPFARDPVDPGLPEAPPRLAGPSILDEPGPAHWIFVPTDGSTTEIERVRTLAINAAPYGLSRTSDDWTAARLAASGSGSAAFLQYAMLFVIVVAASSLTVSVIATMVERRRPFALLRASGMPLGQLRRMAMFETAVPLVVTAVAGMVFALALGFLIAMAASVASPGGASATMAWPGGSFFASAGIGLVATVGLSLLCWPIMDKVTRHDGLRYE